MIPIDNNTEEQRVKEPIECTVATSYWIKADYNGVVRPYLLTPEQRTANNTSNISNIPAFISYLHACVDFPVIVTWIHGVNKGWVSTWLGLTLSRVQKFLKPCKYATMGYLKMILKIIQSTRQTPQPDEPEPLPKLIIAPTDDIHDVYVHCFENPLYEICNIISFNLPGCYLDTSFDG